MGVMRKCRAHSLSKSAVLKILADAGVQMRMCPMTPAQIETARLLYESGLSLSKVAQTTVQRTLWRHGVTLRAPNEHTAVPTPIARMEMLTRVAAG